MFEFQRGCPIHRAIHQGWIASAARIDKIYVNAPAGAVCDWHPFVGVQWEATFLNEPSGRAPLYLQLRPGRPPGDKVARRVQSWVVRKLIFVVNVKS
eukprot:7571190-Pyramimonas_sp.AAC.1